ncbi:toprim domain-containing protein [Rhizobium sp. PL01]|uniref:DUF7146 domain-containing protein n=1 Tax=Rhizobium sp. PL01 TaxID=3085631 RepID=UPI0029829A29|nr:toprim domain-containing protein [Rhizobium sp. PL01]MDW5313744.1 toprim domain-containing protein [Rhizobium sp. PL01]
MNRSSDLPQIKQKLKDDIELLCRKLLPPPDGRRQGRLWVAHNPVENDFEQSPEFKVALDRDRGAWKDWRSGETGDVIKLISYIKGIDFRETLVFARDFTGIRQMSSDQRRKLDERTREVKQRDVEDDQAQRLKRMGDAERIWNGGYQDGAGSAAEAHARRYFAARAIPLDEIPNRDLETLRFAPSQEFWSRAQYRYQDGRRVKIAAGPKFPAIYSAMRLATGQVAAVHMTFLDPMGPQKLPVSKDENAKIMFGEAKGAVIRIAHGPEGEPPETALQPHPLIMGEGIETTASVAICAPEARAWAAGSLSNMLNAPVWLPCVSSIVLLKDHFKSPATEKQFDQAVEAMVKTGKPVAIIDSYIGNDFNDLMQEGESDE